MEDLVDCLKRLLANSVVMSYKAQGHHWNVEGPMFHQFHAFFKDIYEDVDGAIDSIAENIRKLGDDAPFNLQDFVKLTDLKTKSVGNNALAMVTDLHAANEAVIDCVDECFKAATAANEQGIANDLAGRDGMHKKWRWQLEATLKR